MNPAACGSDVTIRANCGANETKTKCCLFQTNGQTPFIIPFQRVRLRSLWLGAKWFIQMQFNYMCVQMFETKELSDRAYKQKCNRLQWSTMSSVSANVIETRSNAKKTASRQTSVAIIIGCPNERHIENMTFLPVASVRTLVYYFHVYN